MYIPREHVDETIHHIDNDKPLLERAGVPKHIMELLNSLHSDSWFKVGASEKLIIARKGGRQGCRYGGKIFNTVYDAALIEIREQMRKASQTSSPVSSDPLPYLGESSRRHC